MEDNAVPTTPAGNQTQQPNPIQPSIQETQQSNPPPPTENKKKISKTAVGAIAIFIVSLITFASAFGSYKYINRSTTIERNISTNSEINLEDSNKNAITTSGSISKEASTPGWVTYTDYQYNFTIEHPEDIAYFQGMFVPKRYVDIYKLNIDEFEYLDIPNISFNSYGIGEPKQTVIDKLYEEFEASELAFKNIRINNAYGVQLLRDGAGWDREFTYYLTSDIIKPLTFEILAENEKNFDEPTEFEISTSEVAKNFGISEDELNEIQELAKIQNTEAIYMDGIAPKMLATLKFLDVKDKAKNWKTYKLSDQLSFKYPNNFFIGEEIKGLIEVESNEDEGYLFKYIIDTRKTGLNTNYNLAYSSFKKNLSEIQEKEVAGYKVLSGYIGNEESEKFFNSLNVDPGGGYFNSYYNDIQNAEGEEIDIKKSNYIYTIALIPYEKSAIVIYFIDDMIEEIWLDEILENIQI